jgi:Zn-dependent protease
MHALGAWSLNLGRWGGVHVRLHIFFLLFAVCAFYVGTSHLAAPHAHGVVEMLPAWQCAMALGILFVSVLVHEFAHYHVTCWVGGHVEEIVIGPLCGLAEKNVLAQPHHELAAALAGPLGNLVVGMLAAPLFVLVEEGNLLTLLHPFTPQAVSDGSPPVVALKLTFWLNWVLVLVNLLPTYPFDGGRVLRSILWPTLGYRTAVLVVARIAKLFALAIFLSAWLLDNSLTGSVVPGWVPLVLLAIFVYFSANQDIARLDERERHGELFDYEDSSAYASAVREDDPARGPQQGFLERWLEKRRLAQETKRRQREAAEEARLDTILARLHATGLGHLSAEDRALLRRVSARYRNRLKH